MTFEEALFQQIYALSPDSPHWTLHMGRVLNHMESHVGPGPSPGAVQLEQAVRTNFGIGPVCPVDWSAEAICKVKTATAQAIDWAAIIAFVVQYAPVLLALLASLFGLKK